MKKNQNFPVYITIASLTSLIVALKKHLYDLTIKTFLYITKTCNMHESQKCRINTINSKTLKKLLKIIQIWGSLLSRQSFGNRTQETNIKKKQVINAMSKGGTLFLLLIGQLSPVKKSVKVRKSVINEESESFEKYFVVTF